jgi:pimeloyl-ACP methyl ester carboxylesterase
MRRRLLTINGHEVACYTAGAGPVVVLVHGMAGSSATWKHVMPALAKRFTVVAPDLLGHGESAKPRADYSLGAHASILRDLLNTLGHDRATLVGQSLGGGVVMQFAYQFPERSERLVLVSSGGLGRGVGHYPHCEAPQRFVDILVDFLTSTAPAQVSERHWRELFQPAPEKESATHS